MNAKQNPRPGERRFRRGAFKQSRALIYKKLPNEPIFNFREVFANEPLATLSIDRAPKSEPISAGRQCSKRNEKAMAQDCQPAVSPTASRPGPNFSARRGMFPLSIFGVPIHETSNPIRPNPTNSSHKKNHFSNPPPGAGSPPKMPGIFSPKSDWSNRPYSTIVWPGFEKEY